jgi:hypothetical protein
MSRKGGQTENARKYDRIYELPQAARRGTAHTRCTTGQRFSDSRGAMADGDTHRRRVCHVNDDLWKSPFDGEFEAFVLEVKNLLVPMLEAVQKYGLKKRHLHKFSKQIDQFYERVITDRAYHSDLAIKYQSRFKRYRQSLFTFLNTMVSLGIITWQKELSGISPYNGRYRALSSNRWLPNTCSCLGLHRRAGSRRNRCSSSSCLAKMIVTPLRQPSLSGIVPDAHCPLTVSTYHSQYNQ